MAATWLEDVRTWSSPNPDDEGVSLLAGVLLEVAGAHARVGLPQGPETHLRMPLRDWQRLLDLMPGVEIVDATDIVRCLRIVKSPAEIDKIAHVCQVVSGAFATLPELVHAGMSEIEIFRCFRIDCLQRGVDEVRYLVGGAGPGGYDDIISPPSERRLKDGDVLVLDTGSVFDGYFCDFDRNWAVGWTDPAASSAYEVLYEATEAGLEAARPGATCADVHSAMDRVIRSAGAIGDHVGRFGHGLGMELTEWPSNRPGDETVLEPGMVLTLEPGMGVAPGRMMVHEENIVVGEGGARLLSRRAPATLPVIE
jgi:Xaa-Pro aminopeptidase